MDEQAKALRDVLGGMLSAIEADSVEAAEAFANTGPAIRAKEAIRAGDIRAFHYAVQYPFYKLIDGLLAKELPGPTHELRFLLKNSRFVEAHLRQQIERHEGIACCADKTRTVLAGIFRFLKTGKEISFDYSQKYTFHLPKRVFREHAQTIQFFEALRALYGGSYELYLEALASIQSSLKEVPE